MTRTDARAESLGELGLTLAPRPRVSPRPPATQPRDLARWLVGCWVLRVLDRNWMLDLSAWPEGVAPPPPASLWLVVRCAWIQTRWRRKMAALNRMSSERMRMAASLGWNPHIEADPWAVYPVRWILWAVRMRGLHLTERR